MTQTRKALLIRPFALIVGMCSCTATVVRAQNHGTVPTAAVATSGVAVAPTVAPPLAPQPTQQANPPVAAGLTPATPAPPEVATPTVARGQSTDRIAVTDEPVTGITVRRGSAETVINAPLEWVARTMTDYPRYTEFMPHVHESRVVRRNRAQTDLYLQVPLTPTLGVIWTLIRLTTTQTPNRVEIVGEAIDGNMDHFETHTVLERVAGAPQTRFVFSVLAIPRLPFPSSVFTREMRGAARTVADNVTTRTERAYALSAIPPHTNLRVPAPPPDGTASR